MITDEQIIIDHEREKERVRQKHREAGDMVPVIVNFTRRPGGRRGFHLLERNHQATIQCKSDHPITFYELSYEEYKEAKAKAAQGRLDACHNYGDELSTKYGKKKAKKMMNTQCKCGEQISF